MPEPNEVNVYRNEAVMNHTSGAMVFNNTTGQESVSIAHRGGGSLVFGNQTTSEVHPNNKQTNTQGDSYSTVGGDRYSVSMNNREDRVIGDYLLMTGSPEFLNGPVASIYLDKQTEIATAQCSPEDGTIGIGNNSGAMMLPGVDSVSVLASKEIELIDVARNMGEGGNIQLLSCKHINIVAGTVGAAFDSGIIKPEGLRVPKRYTYQGRGTSGGGLLGLLNKDEPVESVPEIPTTTPIAPTILSTSALGTISLEETYIPQFEEVNTASTLPFGDITINATTKLNMQAGPGGVDIKTTGSIKLGGSGSTTIGGAQIMIGAGNKAGRGCVYVRSAFTSIEGDTAVNIKSPATLIQSDDVTITGNTVINGDLIVGKNLVVTGSITAGSDVQAGGVSLRYHTHLTAGIISSIPIPNILQLIPEGTSDIVDAVT